MPQKYAIPKTFSDKPEDWRAWQEELADYLDTKNPGIKQFLKEVDMERDPIDEHWKSARASMYPPKVLKDEVQLYRALKLLTAGAAKKVIGTVVLEDGLLAWQCLRQRFEPTLTAKQGVVLAEFANMAASRAKQPYELLSLMTEMEKKIKLIEELTGEVVGGLHKKSVLIGLLDPITRQHTAMRHNENFEVLKQTVVEFVSNAVIIPTGGSSAMQVDSTRSVQIPADSQKPAEQSWEKEEWEQEEEGLNALGQAGMKCYNCQGFGHLARNCSSEQKPKGKGKGNGAQGNEKGGGGYGSKGNEKGGNGFGKAGKGGKGKGRAPRYGGCYTCGGAHFASDCPGGGKGSGGKGGLRSVESNDEQVRHLSYSLVECVPRGANMLNKENQCGTCGEEFMIKKPTVDTKKEETNVDEDGYKKVTSRNGRKNAKKKGGQLILLKEVENEKINNLNNESLWEEIELAVDSGATETVMGEDMLECVEVKEGRASKAGVEYEVANGDKIPNLGEKKFIGQSEEGVMRGITAQVCHVNKALLSVKRMMNAGNRVVFDEDGSFIEDKTTKKMMWFKEEKGLFVVKLWAKKGF